MAQKRAAQILVALICIGFVILGIMVRFYPLVPDEPILPPLDPLPPADETPGEEIIPTTIDNVTFSAKAVFFMFLPHRPPNQFSFDLEINVTNDGLTPLTHLDAVKASVFFQNNSLLYTFGLTPAENYTIESGEEQVLNYDNDHKMPNVLSRLQSELLYLRVLVTYNSTTQAIITSPLTNILVAIE
jgi:hypothetical protein